MKAHIFLIVIIGLFLGSCTGDDDNLNSIEVKGRLVSEITGEGIANGNIFAYVNEYKGSGIFAHAVEIDSKDIRTDANGYFSTTLNYKDKNNVILFEQINDETATGLLQEKRNFYISELKDTSPLVLLARKYETLEIKVRSIDPFDENDALGVYIYQTNTNYYNSIIYKIENFGDQNEQYEYPASENGLNPYWIGNDVNTTVLGNIQEGSSFNIKWSVRKDGIVNEYESGFIDTVSGETNFYEINY